MNFVVSLLEDCDAFTRPEDMTTTAFRCFAKDESEAAEMAEEEYPNCTIVSIRISGE